MEDTQNSEEPEKEKQIKDDDYIYIQTCVDCGRSFKVKPNFHDYLICGRCNNKREEKLLNKLKEEK